MGVTGRLCRWFWLRRRLLSRGDGFDALRPPGSAFEADFFAAVLFCAAAQQAVLACVCTGAESVPPL